MALEKSLEGRALDSIDPTGEGSPSAILLSTPRSNHVRNRIIRDFTRLGIGTAVLIAIYGSDSQGQQPSASTRPTGPVY